MNQWLAALLVQVGKIGIDWLSLSDSSYVCQGKIAEYSMGNWQSPFRIQKPALQSGPFCLSVRTEYKLIIM